MAVGDKQVSQAPHLEELAATKPRLDADAEAFYDLMDAVEERSA